MIAPQKAAPGTLLASESDLASAAIRSANPYHAHNHAIPNANGVARLRDDAAANR
jgi:hypothetical protein